MELLKNEAYHLIQQVKLLWNKNEITEEERSKAIKQLEAACKLIKKI